MRHDDDHFQGLGESASDSESTAGVYVPAIQAPLCCQDFEYYWNEELVIAYHQLKDLVARNGWALFENLDFCDFCKFAYAKSSKTKPVC